MFDVIEAQLGSAVADGGTFTIGYPTNRDDGDYAGGYDHRLYAMGAEFKATEGDISLSFGATNITVTYNGATTIPAGTDIRMQVDKVGANDSRVKALLDPDKMADMRLVMWNLGAPLVLDVDAVCAAQDRTGAGVLVIDGSGSISGGVFTNDVPRNLIVDSTSGTNAAVLTITGTDALGNVMVEDITLNNQTAVAGKKAFKTVTEVSADGTCDEVFVGTGDVLGLPGYLGQKGWVITEMQDGAAATAGTFVVGDSLVATATTGDVRGTYDPNAAADGAKDFQILVAVPDPSYAGVPQFTG